LYISKSIFINSTYFFAFIANNPNITNPTTVPAVIPDSTAFLSLSFSLLIFAPVANIDFSNANINCSGYVSVNTFTRFLSTNNPRQNQDSIGINENIAKLLAIRNNRFICFLLFLFLVLFF